jgi:amino acid adenylation domain-containing protein
MSQHNPISCQQEALFAASGNMRYQDFPLSSVQKRFWFAEQYQPGTSVNHVRFCFRLAGKLNVEALERAFTAVSERHDVLRARFTSVDGQPVQSIDPASPVVVPLIDLAGRPEPVREREAMETAVIESERPFHLDAGGLFRPTLLRLSSDEHLLLITIHHIVFDAWSAGILFRELAAAYESPSEHSHRPDTQYADFARWQHEWLNQDAANEQLNYWSTRLSGASTLVELSLDRPRPQRQTWNGAQVRLNIPATLTKSFTLLARSNGATLFMALYAAFRVLLSRHCGQADLLVGTPVAWRTSLEYEALIGCFVNLLVLRTPIDEDKTFVDLLQAAIEDVLQALENQDLPFERLVESLHPERDLSRPALVQVCFALQNALKGDLYLAGSTVTPVPLPSRTSRFELALDIYETNNGLTCVFEFNTDLFSAETIRRMAARFEHLLTVIVDRPTAKLAELDMLTPAERSQMVLGWNRTRAPYPETACVHDLIAAQARRTPDRVAVEFQDQRLTYAELDERSSRLASYLRHLGVTVESTVGVCLERSIGMMVAVLAVMKAGGAYVPLDPGFPPQRLAYMLEDSGAAVLLTEHDQLTRFSAYPGMVVAIDESAAAIHSSPAEFETSGVQPGNLIYVMYTSGSTGKPKGVMVPHRAVVNFLESMRKEPGFTENDSVLAVTTLSFDIAVLELYLPLITGGRVIIATRETAMNGARLAGELAARKATVLQATPATWRFLIESGWNGDRRLKALCGGEAMSRELAEALLARAGSVWNMYGPTETAVWSLVARVQPESGPVFIGRPIANTTAYVLDACGRPAPVGVAGELHIGGHGLARGYRNSTDLTAKKFIANPLAGCGNERIYNTGDLARYRADGQVEYLGRIDGQLKLRGYRIEVGEIESVLRQHPAVRDAIVVLRANAAGDPRLAAYLIAAGAVRPPVSALRQHVAELLPEYMTPATFIFVDALPLTANGKVDRNALPGPDTMPQVREPVPPQTPLEETLLGIFKDLLGVSAAGVTDNFFELGGHSLLAARLITRIEKETGHNVPVATLFQAPTVQLLALQLQNGGYAASWSPLVKLRKSDTPAAEPLFCVHWHGAKLVTFQKLASMLRDDRPVYGLHPRSLDAGGDAIQTIGDMAAYYIREIRTIHPHGPYHLAGSCIGGVVAFEIAQQLAAAGEKVGVVLLIDSFMPGTLQYLHDRRAGTEYVDWYLGEFLLSPLGAMQRWFNDWLRMPFQRLRNAGQFDRSSARQKQVNLRAAETYRPKSYPGKITLLMCSDAPYRTYEDRRLAWHSVAEGGLEIHVVPGNHETMEREPNIQVIGNQLQACFDRLNHLPSAREGAVTRPLEAARMFNSTGVIQLLPNDCA